MKKRFASLFLILTLILSLSACDIAEIPRLGTTDSPHTQTTEGVAEYKGYTYVDRNLFDFRSDNYNKKELNYGYNSLPNDDMKACYDEIDKSVYYISDTKNTDTSTHKTLKVALKGDRPLTEAEIRVTIAAYFGDHPQVFWIDNNFEYALGENSTVIQLFSFMGAGELEDAAVKMNSKIDEIFTNMEEGLDEYERELFLHDIIVKFCTYNNDVSTVSDDFAAFTSYGALVKGDVVCEGYSRSLQLLLSVAGIESYCVLGVGQSELHMWNCVNIDGNWYYTDATWNEDDTAGVSYDYFNLSKAQMSLDHSFNPLFTDLSEDEICGSTDGSPKSFNIIAPDGNREDMNYYVKSAVCVKNLDEADKESIVSAIKKAAVASQNEDFAVYLYIDESLGYYYAIDDIFYSGDYIVFDAIDDVNAEGLAYTIDRNSVGTRKVEALRGVNVYLCKE